LGVKPGADLDTIRAAYRKSAKELHPDINQTEKAHYYFTILQNAYEYLINHQELSEKLAKNNSHIHRDSYKNNNPNPTSSSFKRIYRIRQYTLHEVLRNSLTARILYIFFHAFFLLIGFFLIYSSVYDLFTFGVEENTNVIAAYLSIGVAIIFGIFITGIFLLTGYEYLRYR
jgi:curved DNA-binding protein CbpA